MPEPVRIVDVDSIFFSGMDSSKDPGQLPLGYYSVGINTLNVGGVISCRPGYRCIIKLPRGKLQGATIFRPQLGLEQMVVVVDGVVYVSPYPFKNFTFLTNVLLSSTSKQVFWAQTIQTAERRTTDLNSAINIIPPRNVLFIQDGGSTAPAWYDGSNSGHVRDHLFETPVGSSMQWIGDRLWVAKGNNVFASDISNPFSFREQIYLGGTSAFTFSGDVTALSATPSLDFPQLLVFTETDASILQANIRNRELWPETAGFQQEVFQIGCTSQRSARLHHGELSWFSPGGVVFFNAARAGRITSHMPIRDNEMSVSKTKLSSDLSLVASANFGNYVLYSVPAEDAFNKHTWVLNGAALNSFAEDSGESWAGIWIGTCPVEWVTGQIAGAERCYHVSTDADGENRLWEAFLPSRLDNGCPIMWAVETRGYFGATSQKKPTGDDCRIAWADVALVGVEEDLDLGVFFAGGLRGAYKKILGKKISVERGCLDSEQIIEGTSQLFAYKPQSRKQRTQDANNTPDAGDETGSCPVESDQNENLDESFQLLIVGHGPAAIRYIRLFALSTPPDLSGEAKACIAETPFNTIRFDGSGVRADDYSVALEELTAKALDRYTAHKTATVSQAGFSAVGVGFSESVVSQEAADRVAQIIATKAAEADLSQFVPPVTSLGQGFED